MVLGQNYVLVAILFVARSFVKAGQSFTLNDVLHEELLNAHAFNDQVDYKLYDETVYPGSKNDIRPYLSCASHENFTQDIIEIRNSWINRNQACNSDIESLGSSSTVYYDKKRSLQCHLVYLTPREDYQKHRELNELLYRDSSESPISSTALFALPSFLNIDKTILDFFQTFQSTFQQTHPRHSRDDLDQAIHQDNDATKSNIESPESGYILSVEYNSCENYDQNIFQEITNIFNFPVLISWSNGNIFQNIWEEFQHLTWFQIITSTIYGKSKESVACDKKSAEVKIRHNMRSIDFYDISTLSQECLLSAILHMSGHKRVTYISLKPMPKLLNYDATRTIQSGKALQTPYSDFGLNGQGQICGVADSGVYDLSCFFLDDSNSYPTITTNRSGILQEHRRKIIQYVGYADGVDDLGGHGTHVVGSIAGNSVYEFNSMNGIANKAKIAFFDIGVTQRNYLLVPPLEELFDWSYDVGARVHSNSWGNEGGIYGSMSYDMDQYCYTHPDFLPIFAAGNAGAMGLFTINSPGNAKNTLTVGAIQLHEVLSDSMLILDDQSSVASFSSVGPTFDGRLKPEIAAPGDYLMSAYAGSPDSLQDALLPGYDGEKICSTHQMSGTSMATPVTAGTAILIRQYFQDEKFWARMCNPRYQMCKNGPFTPTGYCLKALIMHAGEAVSRYSEPIYDLEPTFFRSFKLHSPPDVFQGYGQVELRNILPLFDKLEERSPAGLDPKLDLIVFDDIRLKQNMTIRFDVDFSSIDIDQKKLLPLKVTIAWFDPPAPLSSVRKLLIHDLDLIVVDPFGNRWWGNRPMTSNHKQRTLDLDYYPLSGKDKNSSSLGVKMDDVDWSDDRNPQEQVHILSPRCPDLKIGNHSDTKGCVYQIFVHSNMLLVNSIQAVAVIITTAGVVEGPTDVSMNEEDQFISNLIQSTKHLSPDITERGIEFNVTSHVAGILGPERNKSVESIVPYSGHLQSIEAILNFHCDYLSSSDAAFDPLLSANVLSPASLELTIKDPSGHAVAVGGADSSLGIADMTTEWPTSWWHSNHNGVFKAFVNVANSHLSGEGAWKAYIYNAWSQSPPVSYDITLTLMFSSDSLLSNQRIFEDGSASSSGLLSQIDLCSDIVQEDMADINSLESNMTDHSQVPQPMDDRMLSKRKEDSQILDGNTVITPVVINIPTTSLGVKTRSKGAGGHHYDPDYNNLEPDIFNLARFKYDGRLHSVQLFVDAFTDPQRLIESRGSLSWLLSVIITAPNKLMAQVGGYQWKNRQDRIYSKRWPDPWIGKSSQGVDWIARRELYPANLNSCPRNKAHYHSSNISRSLAHSHEETDEWIVDLALGLVLFPRPPYNFTGKLVLFFESVNCSDHSTDSLTSFNEDDAWILDEPTENVFNQDASSPTLQPATIFSNDTDHDQPITPPDIDDDYSYQLPLFLKLMLYTSIAIIVALVLRMSCAVIITKRRHSHAPPYVIDTRDTHQGELSSLLTTETYILNGNAAMNTSDNAIPSSRGNLRTSQYSPNVTGYGSIQNA